VATGVEWRSRAECSVGGPVQVASSGQRFVVERAAAQSVA